ncbi:MAG: hypothetical protein DSY76_02955 [Bacteroidetes bacterium]|nr:MAG: hypothetical protein DSY76_02955 [Bacteroidota bacterium]
MEKTINQFNTVIDYCREIFIKKTKDYGTSWRILRTPSLTDQIFIKANRIRSIEEKGEMKIKEDIRDEFIAIVNYSVMALIQLELGTASGSDDMQLDTQKTIELYEKYLFGARDLMLNKNHDYGEAWRDMRISSLTDIILMKILRLKQIEDNKGVTIISEGPEGSYNDMINYSIFALIKLDEENEKR